VSTGERGSPLSCSASDFLETPDEQAIFTDGTVNSGDAFGGTEVDMSGTVARPPSRNGGGTAPESSALSEQQAQPQVNDLLQRYVDLVPPVLPWRFLTAPRDTLIRPVRQGLLPRRR
jgi:hypothetical protein